MDIMKIKREKKEYVGKTICEKQWLDRSVMKKKEYIKSTAYRRGERQTHRERERRERKERAIKNRLYILFEMNTIMKKT